MTITIECQPRPEGSKPRALRREGLVPANLYGHQGTESILLTLPLKTAERLVREARVQKTPVEVKVEGGWSGTVVLQEVQTHPWRGLIYHLSFFAQK
ncbi:50S ribosomal protein L25 [Leptolyngbya sp. FACHB-261]|uniref:50S ribosomal protein L25 n=1 Tax=Leptolyngbya sp. FACHB-261 TaxID=2692806 RepID=UPI00168403DA|nr:50S ribosomal protein L25 [Leptolyngbya sp. FACHB-261]MBD2102786.1 50S ribosomal protein L25 [Leptolyngbya sp. FACHB-261]